MKPFVLWDLDGTLTDPRVGITSCIRYALVESGHAEPAEAELLPCIGPPLQQSFKRLVPGISDAGAWALVEKYRERFSTVGLLENEVYPEIPELLASRQRTHLLATSKPHVYAKRILEHFGLLNHFRAVYGSELDGTRTDKGELIRFILESEKILPHDAVMIGDRKHDILGGKTAGLTTIGVTWGYGGRPELEAAGADYIFDEPKALAQVLLS